MPKYFLVLVTLPLFLLLVLSAHAEEPYTWNNEIPEKKPAPDKDNGKLVLFDVSHGATAGNSDWVMNGGFSDFADDLVKRGYTVREYRGIDKNGDGAIRFYDDRKAENVEKNEAVITFEAIKDSDVMVFAESNRPFTKKELSALKAYVDSGKGIFFVADHYNADRNLNSWDSNEVFNGYNRSSAERFNLGGIYGDLRNPGEAHLGWLAENFGIRFRFNGIDFKKGASGIVDPKQAEGLTVGVKPVLIAAGATLAVVDPNVAKGIVYLAEKDKVVKWKHAVDKGLYFGGHKEGPFVAISKPSAGKAAFIGDSSPIEDSSPLYNRETGGSKSTHPGWTSPGTANVLTLNIIDWLATPESYVGFNSEEHPPGERTFEPMIDAEKADPDKGKPWKNPSGGYDPWNTDTYAKGSYGAPFGTNGGGGGTNPGGEVSVSQFLQVNDGKKVSVIGVVKAAVNDIYGLELADEKNQQVSITIKIPSSLRKKFSPKLNPNVIGSKVAIHGIVGQYMGLKGMKSVENITQK